MKKLQHYINGSGYQEMEKELQCLMLLLENIVAFSTTEGLDIPNVLDYGRTKGDDIT